MKRLLVALMLTQVACAPKKPTKTYVWRFNHCVKNGDHEVCECNSSHQELNARTGNTVTVCE